MVIRETDIAGWFEANSIVGAIFTELGNTEASAAIKTIETKMSASLRLNLKADQVEKLQISFYAFPDSWAGDGKGKSVSAPLYPDLFEEEKKRKTSLLIKRAMDIAGSGAALLLFSPIFLILAAIVKLTSKGPIFFRQARVGQYGEQFVFLKFRSMQAVK